MVIDQSLFPWEMFNREIAACLASDFMRGMQREREASGSKPLTMGMLDSAALYALAKIVRPRIVIETGTYRGMSAAFVLRAMRDAGVTDAILFSVDYRDDETIGMLVPQELRGMFVPVTGNIRDLVGSDLLPAEVDMFIHDSNHQYGHQRWEFDYYWPAIRPGGMLVSHDVHLNASFTDFVSSTYVHDEAGLVDLSRTSHGAWGRFDHLGFIQKR